MKVNLNNIQNYFSTLCDKHNDTTSLSFFNLAKEPQDGFANNNVSITYIVKIEDYAGAYAGDTERINKRSTIALQILYKAQGTEESFITQAYEKAEAFMDDLVARLAYEAENKGECSMASRLDVALASYNDIGPLYDQFYGMRLSIPIMNESPDYNADKWQD